jgi:RND family efflux transporter MFP subunit
VEQTAHAAERQIPGRIEAIHTVELRAHGRRDRQNPLPRRAVREKGDVLFELDDAEPRAALRLAQAEVKSAEATLRQAQQQLSRFESLGSSNAISRHDVDNARMQRDVASAALEQAKARLDARNVTLSYTRITSPIDGRVGHSSFHVGSLVNPASGVLVEVVQLDPDPHRLCAGRGGVCHQSRTACGYQRHEAGLAGADRQQRPARQRRADLGG